MANAELGRGRGGMDTINVFNAFDCPDECPLRVGNGQFRCIKHNGDSTIVVAGGIDRNTMHEFESVAPCMNVRKP